LRAGLGTAVVAARSTTCSLDLALHQLARRRAGGCAGTVAGMTVLGPQRALAIPTSTIPNCRSSGPGPCVPRISWRGLQPRLGRSRMRSPWVGGHVVWYRSGQALCARKVARGRYHHGGTLSRSIVCEM
jgi:hypothetical protein